MISQVKRYNRIAAIGRYREVSRMRSHLVRFIEAMVASLVVLGCGSSRQSAPTDASRSASTGDAHETRNENTDSATIANGDEVKAVWKQVCGAMAQQNEEWLVSLTTERGLRSLRADVPIDRDSKEVVAIWGEAWLHFPLRIQDVSADRVDARFGKVQNEGTVVFVKRNGKWVVDRFAAGD